MKKLLVAIMLLSIPVLFCGTTPKPKPTNTAEQLKKLETQQRELAESMYKLRFELIEHDSELKRLHQQIVALYKELALRIDGKREMRVLIAQYEQLGKEISQLQEER